MKRTPLRRKTPLKATTGFKQVLGRTMLQGLSTASKTRKVAKKKVSLGKLKKQLWELVKQAVRAKYLNPDGSWTCYTCDKRITDKMNAHTAHFVPSSVCGASLRYNMRNLRVCCMVCNVWLGGNLIEYYPRMVKEVGQEEVDRLKQEARTVLIKADAVWYQAQIDAYRLM